jgi:RTX calcium-binding nonapeptide repeat (4 copies)
VYGGAGDDAISYAAFRAGDQVTLDGGGGAHDWINLSVSSGPGQVTPFPLLDLDLASHVAVGSTSWPFSGFESVELTVAGAVADAISAEGTDGPDQLQIDGGAVPVTVYALGGDDQVRTGVGDDSVDGGAGDDTANTGDGQDTCVSVEHPSHCESVTP